MNENRAQSRSDRHQCLFSDNHGHKHLTFPFVGGSWMYILLMSTSQKREKLLLFLTNSYVLDRTAALPGSAAVKTTPRGSNSTWRPD